MIPALVRAVCSIWGVVFPHMGGGGGVGGAGGPLYHRRTMAYNGVQWRTIDVQWRTMAYNGVQWRTIDVQSTYNRRTTAYKGVQWRTTTVGMDRGGWTMGDGPWGWTVWDGPWGMDRGGWTVGDGPWGWSLVLWFPALPSPRAKLHNGRHGCCRLCFPRPQPPSTTDAHSSCVAGCT